MVHFLYRHVLDPIVLKSRWRWWVDLTKDKLIVHISHILSSYSAYLSKPDKYTHAIGLYNVLTYVANVKLNSSHLLIVMLFPFVGTK